MRFVHCHEYTAGTMLDMHVVLLKREERMDVLRIILDYALKLIQG